GRVQDGVEVAAGERRGALGDRDARTQQLELGMARQRLAELVEALARTRAVETQTLALGGLRCRHHGLLPGPSPSIDWSSWYVFALSADFTGGRRVNHQSPLWNRYWSLTACASVRRS